MLRLRHPGPPHAVFSALTLPSHPAAAPFSECWLRLELPWQGDRMRGHGIILEEIRSQNRATIEAVAAFRVALEAKIDQVDRDSRARDALLESAVRRNSKDIPARTGLKPPYGLTAVRVAVSVAPDAGTTAPRHRARNA